MASNSVNESGITNGTQPIEGQATLHQDASSSKKDKMKRAGNFVAFSLVSALTGMWTGPPLGPHHTYEKEKQKTIEKEKEKELKRRVKASKDIDDLAKAREKEKDDGVIR